MTATSSVFLIHPLLQKVVPQPWFLLPTQQLATTNRSYTNTTVKRFRIIALIISLGCFFPFVLYRTCWLFFNWKSYTIYHVDRAVLYGVYLCLCVVYLSLFHLRQCYHIEIIYVVNQLHQVRLLCKTAKKSKTSEISTQFSAERFYKVFFYGIAISHLVVILCCSAFPLVVSYCPLQLTFGVNYLTKVLETLYFLIGISFNILSFLSVILLFIMILDTLILCTPTMFFPAGQMGIRLEKYYKNFRTIELVFKVYI